MKRLALFISLAIMAIACTKTVITPEITCSVDEVTVPVNGTIDEDIFVSFTSNVAWKAAIKENVDWCKVSPAEGEAGDAKLKLIVVETKELDARTATLTITAETAIKEIKIVQGQVDAFELAATEAEIGAEGASIEIKAMTNVDWTVTIPSDCDWVKLADSKAYGEQVKTVVVSAYEALDEEREVTLAIKAANGAEAEFTIYQEGPTSVIWSLDMSTLFPRMNSFTRGEQVIPTNVSMALFNGDVLVCAGDGSDPIILDKATGEKKGVLSLGSNDKPGYITNDDAGNLVYCTRVWNYWSDYQFFTIYYMKPGDTTPTQLCTATSAEYAPSYLGASLSVRGDVTKTAAILAPWEGVSGITGENMVLCWQVTDGNAGDFIKGTLTGFVGINWLAGYWEQSPNNFPGIVLLGDKLTDGALFSCYDENILYYVNSDFTCTKVAETPIIDGNNAPNALEVRTINGKGYLAVSGGCYFPGWGLTPVIDIYDVKTKELLATGLRTSSYAPYAEDGQGENCGASAAVRIEGSNNGLNVYHINNNCMSVEAIRVVLK